MEKEDNVLETISQRIEDIYQIVSNLSNKEEKQKNSVETDLVKIEQAAIITGYTKMYLYELVHKKAIPFIKKGRSIRFDKKELEIWMRADRPNIFIETIKSFKKD